jgi:hypothetical protein
MVVFYYTRRVGNAFEYMIPFVVCYEAHICPSTFPPKTSNFIAEFEKSITTDMLNLDL